MGRNRRIEEEEEEEVAGEEPVTPAGRFFMQSKMQNIIHCAVGGRLPLDIDAIKLAFKDTFLLHPRFCSLVVRDEQGRERWKRTEVDLDKHFVFPAFADRPELDDDEFVNRYLAELAVSAPLDEAKPLWEVHVMASRRVCVIRLHHSLGDGISLMSLFLACCDRAGQPGRLPELPLPRPAPASPWWRRCWRLVGMVWWSLVFIVEFMLSAWVKDEVTSISGGDGVELWPRKVATASFSLEDMKVVKNAIDGTVNDVLIAIITAGIGRYLEKQTPRKPSKPLRITGLALVNTRLRPGLQDVSEMLKSGSKSRWGNQMGYVALPVSICPKDADDHLACLRRAKALLDRKKISLEAHFSYSVGAFIMSVFGPKLATLLNYSVIANTTFTISNVLGPQEEIMFAGNPIKFLRATCTAIPHALTLHMVSYMGKAEMQILVAKDVIPDPKFLAKCFEDSLLDMKKAVLTTIQDRK